MQFFFIYYKQIVNMLYLIWIFVITIFFYVLYRYIQNRKRVKGIRNKAVFITGCDSGFGRALSIQLDTLGCPVFSGCFTENGAKQLKEVTSERLQTLSLDVRSDESIKAALDFTIKHMPEGTYLWGIVNNAGIATYGLPAEFLSLNDYHEMMKVNYLGPVNMVLSFLPLLKQCQGRIVNVSSLVARMPTPLCGAYAGSKSALYGFSESLRREKASSGVKIATIIPGHYSTEITDPSQVSHKIQAIWDRQPDNIKQEYDERQMKHMMEGYVKISHKYSNRNLSQVTDSIEHALFAENPRGNYKCGLDAKVFCFMESLPFGILEYMQSKTFKLAQILYNRINRYK